MTAAQYGKMFTNEPAFIGTLGAQAVEVIADAMNKAGSSTDYDKIAATLKGESWPTLLGDVPETIPPSAADAQLAGDSSRTLARILGANGGKT